MAHIHFDTCEVFLSIEQKRPRLRKKSERKKDPFVVSLTKKLFNGFWLKNSLALLVA